MYFFAQSAFENIQSSYLMQSIIFTVGGLQEMYCF